MLYLNDKNRVRVWEVENKGRYSLVKFSSSRKDKSTGDYLNSSWAFVRFVGDAHEKADKLEEKDLIVLRGAGFSREPYEKDGEKVYPKNPQLVVFNFVWADEVDGDEEKHHSVAADEDDEEELPF